MAKDAGKEKGAAKAAPAVKKSERKVVQVRAVRLGFYGHMLRTPGTVFNIRLGADEKFPSWCARVDESATEEEPEQQSAAAEESKGSGSDEVI